jgi:hypothetical protein
MKETSNNSVVEVEMKKKKLGGKKWVENKTRNKK